MLMPMWQCDAHEPNLHPNAGMPIAIMQVPVYILDVAILCCMAVQLGVQFPCKDAIEDNFNFITNGSLAVVSMVRSCSR